MQYRFDKWGNRSSSGLDDEKNVVEYGQRKGNSPKGEGERAHRRRQNICSDVPGEEISIETRNLPSVRRLTPYDDSVGRESLSPSQINNWT